MRVTFRRADTENYDAMFEKASQMNDKIEAVAMTLEQNWKTYKIACKMLGYEMVCPYTRKGYKIPKNCLVLKVSFNPLDDIFVRVKGE